MCCVDTGQALELIVRFSGELNYYSIGGRRRK